MKSISLYNKWNKKNTNVNAIMRAVLAAVLYGISAPVSKLLLEKIPPTLMAALLYLGAGIGMLIVNRVKHLSHIQGEEAKLTKKELPFTIGMIVLDIAAPILLMFGLTLTSSANAALLNNFEIVSTSLIALLVFKEAVGKRMWLAIIFITMSSIILTIKDISSFSFTIGSVFVLLACVCWGFENNCTRMLSMKNPLQIVVLKGFGSGIGALLISIAEKQFSNNIVYIFLTLVLGFIAYGLSIYFYIFAQRDLGAARTSTFYATAPFIGVIISWLIFHEGITITFLAALVIMLIGTYFAVSEVHNHLHTHLYITHEHKHNHTDGHHNHAHNPDFIGEHSHEHNHEALTHMHTHTPDIHHTHMHS